MFAQVSGLEAGELVHVISDMHIYDRHIEMVKQLLKREPKKAPKVTLNTEIKNFYDFTVENYEYGTSLGKIPVAI
jgi:thymidylate synthase